MIVSLFAPHTIVRGDKAGEVVPGWSPSRWDTTWSEFVETLQASAATEANPAEKTSVLALSCAEFVAGTNRAKANVIGCDLIGFDFDDKTGTSPSAWTFESLVGFMKEQGAPFVVHTTASCRENAHCLRLLLPFDRRVGPTEFPIVWRAFSTWLGSVADEATKDESRVFFEPRRWKGRHNRFHAGHSGRAPVNVNLIVERYAPSPPIGIAPVCRAALPLQTRESSTIADITDLDLSPIVLPRALEQALAARPGGRMYRFLCSVACCAQRMGVLVTEGDLVTMALALSRRLGKRDDSDVRRDVINSMHFAAQVVQQTTRAPTNSRGMMPRYW